MNVSLGPQPSVSSEGHPVLKAGVLLVAIILVGILACRQVQRLVSGGEEVWVAKRDLAVGERVQPSDLEQKVVASDELSEGVVREGSAISGRTLVQAKEKGEPFYPADFAPVKNGNGGAWLAELVPEGRVLASVAARNMGIHARQFRRGDRIDLIAVYRKNQPRVIVKDAYIVEINYPERARGGGGDGSRLSKLLEQAAASPPRAERQRASLLLALHPEDVMPLAQAMGHRAGLGYVLHGQRELEEGRLLDLPPVPVDSVEVIAGSHREQVKVGQ